MSNRERLETARTICWIISRQLNVTLALYAEWQNAIAKNNLFSAERLGLLYQAAEDQLKDLRDFQEKNLNRPYIVDPPQRFEIIDTTFAEFLTKNDKKP